MSETKTIYKTRTWKEIDDEHTMICIEQVSAIRIESYNNYTMYCVVFCICNESYPSKDFDTEEEAIQFRNEIMGWDENGNRV